MIDIECLFVEKSNARAFIYTKAFLIDSWRGFGIFLR